MFICGSLEPRKDGVGDYVVRLSSEIYRQGHQVSIAAINDRHISKYFMGIQNSEEVNLSVCRIPSAWLEKDRFQFAEKWINKFDPDWLSLQFVPFSFHDKGLSTTLGVYLRKLGKNRNWHIMFHELWVGMDQRSGIMLNLWGKVQKYLIKSLILQIKPRLIHTQTKLYQLQLENMGLDVLYLPLFSNIPVASNFKVDTDRSDGCLMKKNPFVLILFGGIHPGAPVNLFAKAVARFIKENEIQILLKIVGNCGIEQENWASTWRSFGLQIELLGEQPSKNISNILRSGSLGITTTPFLLAEKSSAVAAMLEHGLNVLCIAKKWKPRDIKNFPKPMHIIDFEETSLEKILNKQFSSPKLSKLSDVSSQLIMDFGLHLA